MSRSASLRDFDWASYMRRMQEVAGILGDRSAVSRVNSDISRGRTPAPNDLSEAHHQLEHMAGFRGMGRRDAQKLQSLMQDTAYLYHSITRGERYTPNASSADEHEPMHTNGRPTTSDPVAARELSLYIENEYSLIGAPNSIGKSIDANLRRKLTSGTYDSSLAPKAWQYLIDAGAKKYEAEFGDSSPIFNAATRRSVAADFARAWEQENLAGHLPNARRVPDYLQGYEDWTQKDFEEDLRGKGYGVRAARYHAAHSAQQTGRTNYLPPRVPPGWKLSSDPIFSRRTAKPAFVAYKGGKYQVFDHAGRSLSGELRNMRLYHEWRDSNGYGEPGW